MGELYIGTSGYDYPEWKGLFYPEKLARNKFLEYYSRHFNALELNGTYYRMPSADQMRNMIERSQRQVKFSVKAFQGLTHAVDISQYKILMEEFKRALEPLLIHNLLLCVLFQFPESFHYEKENRVYLDLLLREVTSISAVIEMRNSKWQNDQVYAGLRERDVGWCVTDNPNLKNLMQLEFVSTSDTAYLRFHGRNAKMWYSGDNVTRYDYLYSDEELQSFVEPISQLLMRTKIVQLFFNNHAKSQAVVNAKKIEMLLKGALK